MSGLMASSRVVRSPSSSPRGSFRSLIKAQAYCNESIAWNSVRSRGRQAAGADRPKRRTVQTSGLPSTQWTKSLPRRAQPGPAKNSTSSDPACDGFTPCDSRSPILGRPIFESPKAPAPTASLRRLLLSASAVCAFAGVFGVAPAVAATQIETLDSKAESQLLADSQSCGKLVRLADGIEGQGVHLSIHGLGAAPADMAPLTSIAEKNGQATATFAYNTMHCDHNQNTQALAAELTGWLAEHPGEKLTIETHSLGGRMILGAIYHLQNANQMPSQDIRLNLVAPPLAGFGLFNLCLAMPGPVARLIPGAASTRDMASLSGAQKQLDEMHLPGNVKTTIYYGNDDGWIDYTTTGAARMASKLDAQVYYLADKGHYDMVDAVARATPDQLSSTPLKYLPGVRPDPGN